MQQTQDILLQLLRTALWGEQPAHASFEEVDWKQLFRLAHEQTVAPLILEGIDRLPAATQQLPPEQKFQHIASLLQTEQANRLHIRVILKIDQALRKEGIRAAFMKGQVVARRYPHPLHRTPGDIDFVVAEKDFSKTMEIMAAIGEVSQDSDHEKHGLAWVDGVAVEPHYKLHDYQRPSTDRAMQALFASVFPTQLQTIRLGEGEVAVFPPTFESVFLLSHMVHHVYGEGLGLRQVIDYALLLYKDAAAIDWGLHDKYLRALRMERTWRIFSCLCVDHLGLPRPAKVKPFSTREKEWARDLMADILHVGNFGRAEYQFRYDRWRDRWKNYVWVVRRCRRLGFVCPSEARWWVFVKPTRFLHKTLQGDREGTSE